MSNHNFLNVMPFYRLTDFQLQMENESCRQKFLGLLEEKGLLDFIKNTSPEDIPMRESYQFKYYDVDEYNYSMHKDPFTKLMHVNSRMLAKNRGKIKAYINMLDQEPEILLLSEIGKEGYRYLTHTFPHYDNLYDLPLTNKYGGVAILTKRGGGMKASNDLKLDKKCNCDTCQFENIWAEVKIGADIFTSATLYRHPGGNTQHFVESLND